MMTLNHGFSGYICGRVAMPVLKRYAPISQGAMGWAFFIGAMMPDGDVLTRLVGGRGNYFGGAWYSHRQFSHSLLGTLVYALLIAAVVFAPVVWRHERRWRAYAWTVGCLWVGGWLHLLGDMMTPGRPLPIFWPLPETFGAWGHIGWFSPYLLVIFLAVLIADVILRGVARMGSERWRMGVAALT
ncbi:MAG TPA: metal-dependent hydrolase, partial [bacterium]